MTSQLSHVFRPGDLRGSYLNGLHIITEISGSRHKPVNNINELNMYTSLYSNMSRPK